ncbi:MAG: porin, partial [Proteobacteria bacterium]|nr:porin [Pseudomonadota bacterium]
MGNGMVLGAYTMKSEDDLDAGEEYSASGVEVQYTIAAGLTAVVNVSDYDYKIDSTGSATADSGTISKLTIKAAF